MIELVAMEEPEPDSDPDPDDARRVAPDRIRIDNPNRYPEAGARALRPWLETLIEGVAAGAAGALAVRFVSDREMRGLNLRFRGKDATTDVLSFPGSDTPEGPHLGDIAISLPAARRQALEHGHPVRREIELLLLHGLLHCLGHDHETDGGEMLRLERRLRRRWIDGND